jgi:hypothetical protein
MQQKGIVYLIGAGPGDPGLLTLKGLRILQKADVVIFDRLVGSALLSMARSDAEMIYVGSSPGGNQSTAGRKGLAGPARGTPKGRRPLFVWTGRGRGSVYSPTWPGI